MARPTTHLDLPEQDRRGEEIIRWSTYSVMGFPSVAKHIVAATEAAQKAGLLVSKDGIFETLAAEQLEERLVRAQDRWDSLKNQYEVALEFPAKSSDSYYINVWARENGYPKIDFIEN